MTLECYHLGLIGYPLGHSRSPALHHAALRAAGLGGEYRLFPVPPDAEGVETIRGLVRDIREQRLQGLNVTIPHKQLVMTMMDRLTDVARVVGAVNTIICGADGQVIGDNTDVPGFLIDVQKVVGAGPGLAVVLGAGGSARAVVYALAQAGWRVSVLARRAEQAQLLAGEIGLAAGALEKVKGGGLDESTLNRLSSDCDLLINTTPLGMHPNEDTCPWPESLALPSRAGVYDLVYNPLETRLVRRARASGLRAASGAGMLVAQGALAFQRWTGLDAPFDVMKKAFYQPVTTISTQG
jgi:shikimate dehydrogenase